MAPGELPAALWVACLAALLGSLQYGYAIGVLNTSLSAVLDSLDTDDDSLLSSAVVAGAALGALCAGRLADGLGPRRAQLLNALPFALGGALAAVARGPAAFIAARAVAGFGAGAASLLTPRYIAEISVPALRGRIGSMHQVFINIGILLAYLAGIPYEREFSGFNLRGQFVAWWRVMVGLQLLPAALQAVALLGSPESPVWLEGAGHSEAADEAFLALWGPYAIVPGVEEEEDGGAGLLDPAAAAAARRKEGWGGLAKPEYRRMLSLSLLLPLLQQASGINTVIYYSSLVFLRAGLKSPILGSILVGAINLAFTGVASALMDRRGRKPLLQVSFAGMAVSLAAVAAAGALPVPPIAAGLLTVALMLIYVAFFAIGCGPIPWVVLSEILPPRIKGPAASLATAAGWLGNLAVTLSFDALLSRLGVGGAYLLYALLNVGAGWYVSAHLVETKMKSLQEIEEMLLLPPRAASPFEPLLQPRAAAAQEAS
ncbi:plastidic glucose transporter [Raphidocelis subcapitata]|uniref:Plastidic glucose transporter n=1 Tax=Raphidocelis subcapitata TaxID=307507 RepID=A0A2V0NT65_9CHLO|nr:plastidic glucose transporter [Raphidocelis subcapitata]|eukprot:GBF90824.1 plastidic glucose transporter [Raphidocelis subcapitata]